MLAAGCKNRETTEEIFWLKVQTCLYIVLWCTPSSTKTLRNHNSGWGASLMNVWYEVRRSVRGDQYIIWPQFTTSPICTAKFQFFRCLCGRGRVYLKVCPLLCQVCSFKLQPLHEKYRALQALFCVCATVINEAQGSSLKWVCYILEEK